MKTNKNTAKAISQADLDNANKVIAEKNKKDMDDCTAEVNKILNEQVIPVLNKYGCYLGFEVYGRDNQMQVQQKIFKK